MARVIALRPFVHGSIIAKRGDVLTISDFVAMDLKRVGLVKFALDDAPAKKILPEQPAAPLFVLPPDLPSPETTATESVAGVKKSRRKKAEQDDSLSA